MFSEGVLVQCCLAVLLLSSITSMRVSCREQPLSQCSNFDELYSLTLSLEYHQGEDGRKIFYSTVPLIVKKKNVFKISPLRSIQDLLRIPREHKFRSCLLVALQVLFSEANFSPSPFIVDVASPCDRHLLRPPSPFIVDDVNALRRKSFYPQ